jgi:SAM-dependent methyltransferase
MRKIAERHRDELKLDWVKFVEGTAELIPVPDASADVVISNCVLSLASEPAVVFREIARVLRPGGRFVVSDVLGGARPATVENKTRCESGLTWSEYCQVLAAAGFSEVEPLRLREVSFRDGYRTQSVSVQARVGAPLGRTVQIFASPPQLLTAQRISIFFERAAQRVGAQLKLQLMDLQDTNAQALLELILAENPGNIGMASGDLLIAAEGKPIGIWPTTLNGDEALVEGLVGLALDYLMES